MKKYLDRKTARSYLISLPIIFIVCFLLSLLITSLSAFGFTTAEWLLCSVACAVVPCGAFTGFIIFGLLVINKMSVKSGLIFSLLLVVTIGVVIIGGVVMILPMLVASIKKIM